MNPRKQLLMLPNAWSSIHKNRAVQANSSSVILRQRLFFVPSKKSSTMRPTFRSTPDFVVGMPVCRANWRFAFVMPSSVFQLKPPLFTTNTSIKIRRRRSVHRHPHHHLEGAAPASAVSRFAACTGSVSFTGFTAFGESVPRDRFIRKTTAPATSITSNTVPMKSTSSPKRLTGP